MADNNNAMTYALDSVSQRPVEMVAKFLEHNGWAKTMGVHVLDDFIMHYDYRRGLYLYLCARQEQLDEAQRKIAETPGASPAERTAAQNCGGPGARECLRVQESNVPKAVDREGSNP